MPQRADFAAKAVTVPCFPTTLHMNDTLAPNPLEKNMDSKTWTRIIVLTLIRRAGESRFFGRARQR
jgi:hypothetical protein